jgi:hypothetical protein
METIKMSRPRERGLRAVRAQADLALSSSDDSEMTDEEADDLRRGIAWIDAYLDLMCGPVSK